MKKKLHEISDEELLASLVGEDLSKESLEYKFDNPIASFVQAFKLEAGKEKVPARLLFNLFKNWTRGLAFNQSSFNYQLDSYLPTADTNQKVYLVNKKVLEISKQLDEILKKKRKPKYKSKVWITHFERFLSDTGLEPGTVYVEQDILYYVYNRWCDDNRKKSILGYISFGEMCGLVFDKKHLNVNDLNWIAVNEKIKELITAEEVQRWRLGRKRNAKKENSNADPAKKYQDKALYFQKKDEKKED